MAILAAGINFGKPNTEFILESDENGVAQSCRNVDTGVEYVGGGGSSDFSTAEVTFDCSNNTSYCEIYGVICLESGGFSTYIEVENGEIVTLLVPIYKNTPTELDVSIGEFSSGQVTGNISFDKPLLTVSGDGTITIS